MKIAKLFKIYSLINKFAANLSETLNSLEVSDKTKLFVLNSPKNKITKFIAILKDFPNSSPEELENLIKSNKSNELESSEINIKEKTFENLIEFVQLNYPNKLNDINNIINSQIKYEYKLWIIKQFLEGNSLNDIMPSIEYFDKNKNSFIKKDINSYNAKELENEIKDKELNKETKDIDKGKSGRIFENERFFVVRPDNKNACITYGKGTKWCITMKDEKYYESYAEENIAFYFIIDKKANPQEGK